MILILRKLLTLLLLMSIYPSLAQYPRKANVAIIESDSIQGTHLFGVCTDILDSEGYYFFQSNKDSLSLVTNPIIIHDLPLLFKLEIKVEASLTTIRGYIMDDRNFADLGLYDIPKKWEYAAYRSFSGSMWRIGFDVLVEIVELIRSKINGKVTWYRWQDVQ